MSRSLTINVGEPAGPFSLPLVDWEGSDYWTVARSGPQMANAEAAGWADPEFFPIAVWLSSPADAEALLGLGINTMVATFGVPGALPDITEHGMCVIPQVEDFTLADAGSDTRVVGWLPKDEPDLGFMPFADYMTRCADVRAYDDGRFLLTNFAHGIRRSVYWDGETGGTYGGGLYPFVQMHEGVAANDVACVDQYCYTTPGIRGDFGPQGIVTNLNVGARPRPGPDDPGLDGTSYMWPGAHEDFEAAQQAAAYGWQARALRALYRDKGLYRPCWVTVETQLPFVGDVGRRIVLYDEMRGAVWSALVNEARGIMYFQHNGHYHVPPAFDEWVGNDPNTGLPPNEAQMSLIDGDVALRSYVAALNAKIMSLARVLKSQSYVWNFGADGIETMLKAHAGYAYIFATKSILGTTGSKTFTLPPGVSGGSVEVLEGTGGPLTVTAGAFSYAWANEYDVLIGKVAI